jgi:hypothetical protein
MTRTGGQGAQATIARAAIIGSRMMQAQQRRTARESQAGVGRTEVISERELGWRGEDRTGGEGRLSQSAVGSL